MQNEPAEAALKRESTHAKQLRWGDRQVLAYLQRNNEGKLTIALRFWVAATDEQCCVMLYTELTDERVQEVFEGIDDEMVGELIQILGVPKLIAELERGA